MTQEFTETWEYTPKEMREKINRDEDYELEAEIESILVNDIKWMRGEYC